MALCSLSTGRIVTPRRRAASTISAPAMTSTSLFASAMVLPASIAASTASSPAVPDDAQSTMSTSGCVAAATRPSRAGVGARRAVGQREAPRADRRARRRRDGATARGRYCRICSASSAAFSPAASADDLQAIGMRVDDRRARCGRSIRSTRGWRGASSRRYRQRTGRRPAPRTGSASTRSSTPPWPGMSVELSLTPALRLSSDSNRSPAMPNAGERPAPTSAADGAAARPAATRREGRAGDGRARPGRRWRLRWSWPGSRAGASLRRPNARPV